MKITMTQPNETLAEFIIRRRREIAEAQDRLRVELDALDKEFDQIDKAARAAGIEENAVATESYRQHSGIFMVERTRQRVVAEKTIKEAVLEILKDAGRGMTAIEILPEVNRRLNVDYPRTSLSPQLSRLKADGFLERNGIVWSLVQAPQTEEVPTAGAEGTSKPETAEGNDLGFLS